MAIFETVWCSFENILAFFESGYPEKDTKNPLEQPERQGWLVQRTKSNIFAAADKGFICQNKTIKEKKPRGFSGGAC